MSTEPYASVILPVHGRSLSLFASLSSVRCQSIQDVEIIVSGDGVTGEVKETVEAFARRDPRIRFLDLPKAPGRGEANRDHAVRSARSERIFYIDDDDLWLPRHVEVLGRCLDDLDTVNTPIWSVLPSGRLALAPGNYGAPTLRSLLAQRTLKLVHDTHLAHRKSAYLRLTGGGWVKDADNRPVMKLLSQFAADRSIVWSTIPDVTALSFSSPPRWQYTEAQRLAELMEWLPRSQSPHTPTAFAETASLVPFLLEMTFQVPPADGQTLIDYLAQFCIQVPIDNHNDVHDSDLTRNILRLPLTTRQVRDANTALGLIRGDASNDNNLARILLDIAEAPHGRESMSWHVCNLLAERFGLAESIRITRQIHETVPRRRSLQYLLLSQLHFMKNDYCSARRNLHMASNACNDFITECQTLRSQISAADTGRGAARSLSG